MLFGEREGGKEDGWPTAAAIAAHKMGKDNNILDSGTAQQYKTSPAHYAVL